MDRIEEILRSTKTIAVIGLSPNPARPSHEVTRYMIDAGYEIYGVRPAAPTEVLGRPCVETLQELNADIDLINVFRNSEALPGLMDEIERWMAGREVKPKYLWLQEGVTNAEAEKKAAGLGLVVVANRCILKEHARRF